LFPRVARTWKTLQLYLLAREGIRARLISATLTRLYAKNEESESRRRSVGGKSDGSDGSCELQVDQRPLKIRSR
jgi:hypothetical protein